MNTECLLPYYTAQSGSAVGMFNTTMGKLQRQLYKGEYDIFKYAPIFESDFIQITKRGEVIDVHNRVRMVTVGIACTSPSLPLPDVMLLARPATNCDEYAGRGQATKGSRRKATKALELTRLLPLKFVRISVHDREKQQLRLKFATGRSCYLQLCPPLDARTDLFAYWEKLIYLLRPPMDSNSSTYAIPAEGMSMPVLEEDRSSLGGADLQGKGDQDQVSVRSLHMVSDVCGATSAAYAGGEGVQHDSHKPTSVSNVSISKTKSAELAKKSSTRVTRETAAAGTVGATVSTSSIPVTKSVSPGDVRSTAGEATPDAEGSSSVAIAGSPSRSSENINMAMVGAASKSSENVSGISSNLPAEGIMSVTIAEIESTSKIAVEVENSPAAGPSTSTLLRERSESGTHGRQRSQASIEGRKERRERRERREKDRALGGRSTHHRRTGESRRKTSSDKIARKSPSHSSSSHRASREDRKDKGHSSSHKGVSHTPITKDSRTSHKSGRSLSTASSGSSKRLSRISSFLRNVRANLTTKAGGSPRGRDVGIVAKTVERNTMEAIVEAGESGQDLEVVSSVTSEIMETVTFTAHK
ncbi:Golgi-associated RAB2 interactor protein 4 [Nycticebus coucang]|uniref:Golgi-associated RAB2 interactor protein 4 n=1 Tax=Nycticebus coucang TaxID=9470 RepID=UPI00234C5390|nr:Golgi-associated RAB2 interactor protein 4 [Nycticebus coucang]